MSTAIDTRDLGERDGFTLNAALVPDTDTHPDEFDCYSADDVTAWRDEWWSFVGIVVTARLDGVDIGQASLWGVEHGTMPYGHAATQEVDAWEHEALADLTAEAVETARAWLSHACAAAGASS